MARADPRVSLQIGKGGITDALVAELKDQVHHKGAVKVRALPAARGDQSVSELFSALAEKAGVDLLKVVGFTGLFARS